MVSPAARKFKKAAFWVMGSYFVLFTIAYFVDNKLHPEGISLWLLAAVPVLPILVVAILMGRYLREEKDEFRRDVLVRCLLWGTAGAGIVNLFAGFLRIFGWNGHFFPFTEYFVFCVLAIVAKFSYRAANMVPNDE
jgi:hypothetical protein